MPGESPVPSPVKNITKQTLIDTPVAGSLETGDSDKVNIGKRPEHGTLVVQPDGKWNYQPNKGFSGKDDFTVIVTDADGNSKEQLFDIDVDEIPLGMLDSAAGGSGSTFQSRHCRQQEKTAHCHSNWQGE